MKSQSQREPPGGIVDSDLCDLDVSDLAGIVWGAKSSVFQVETLDSYGVAHEDAVYRAYCEKRKPSEEELAGYHFWFGKVRDAIARGVDVARAHFMPDELNEYLEYEIGYGYRQWCIPLGEKVALLKRSEFPELAKSAYRDFYVIDDARVLFPVYTPDNKFVGLQELTSQDTIQFLVGVKNQIRKCSTPLLAEGPLPFGW